MTTTWDDFEAEAPELAGKVRERFEATGLALVATLRRDGSPRICGVEPFITAGDLWLGMMSNSLKALDLRRDPRFALHSATEDKELKNGDAKVAGRAIEVDDDGTKRSVMAAFKEHNGYAPEGVDFHLFKADLTEASMLTVGGDHLVIERWHPGAPAERIERRD